MSKKMREKMKVAAENTAWRHLGLRAVYFYDENSTENSMEAMIFRESLMCAYFVRNSLFKMLRGNYAIDLLNKRPECILQEYYEKYPELCLISLALQPFGTISPSGPQGELSYAADYAFGVYQGSPLYRANFEDKNIPIIRITDSVFSLGTNQPIFESFSDVMGYYRNDARIDKIVNICRFWIEKFCVREALGL